jgi:hypothetical protein
MHRKISFTAANYGEMQIAFSLLQVFWKSLASVGRSHLRATFSLFTEILIYPVLPTPGKGFLSDQPKNLAADEKNSAAHHLLYKRG